MNEYRHVRVLHQDLKKFEFDLNNLKHLVPKTLQAQQRVDYTGSFNMGTMLIFDPTKSYNGSTGELYYTRENEGGDANVPFLRSRVGSEDNRRQSSVASSRRKSVYSFSSSRRQTEGKVNICTVQASHGEGICVIKIYLYLNTLPI